MVPGQIQDRDGLQHENRRALAYLLAYYAHRDDRATLGRLRHLKEETDRLERAFPGNDRLPEDALRDLLTINTELRLIYDLESRSETFADRFTSVRGQDHFDQLMEDD